MKLTKFLIPTLALAFLAGCSVESDVGQAIVDAVSEIGALVSNGRTGMPYSDRTMTINMQSGDTLSATNVVKINQETLKMDMTNGVTVNISYDFDVDTADNWSIAEGKPDATHSRLAPKILDFEDYNSVLTATISYGETTKEVSWDIFVAQRGYELVVVPIADIRGNVEVNEEITTRGYITGHYENSLTHIYSGVMIADGDSAIMLYAGSLSTLWFQDEYAIGDLVIVSGLYSPYSGLAELKPTTLALSYEFAEVSEPVDLIISSEEEYTKEALTGMDGRIIQINGLVYVSGKESLTAGGSHVTIKMKFGATNVDFRLNYHIGTAVQQEFVDMMANWVANETTINYHGHLGWYSGPQVAPFTTDAVTLAA
ncbi:MAG: hypothetical protein PHT30_03090 [Bacilli bacterium]|nr:hypothetical protein [Bacilli bacterium]